MRFCAAPMQSQASILCVDLTFNLGDFYVTATSYKNPMLLNKQGKHPIHLGPMQVQHRKLKQSYQYFGSALKRFNPKISELKIYGTDNEKQTYNVSGTVSGTDNEKQTYKPTMFPAF